MGRIAAVVLAAGAATRFHAPKQRLLLPRVLERVAASPLDEIVVEVPRAQLQSARYKKGVAVGVFELEFADGSTWAFDVGRAFAKSAGQVASQLGATVD